LPFQSKWVESNREKHYALRRAHYFEVYRDDPVRFAEEVIGLRVWSRQRELLEAVRDHDRVAVRSGQKTSKSNSAATLALWYAATRPGARVFVTAPTFKQVKAIIWKELRLRAKAVTRILGGTMPRDPATGIEFANGSEVIGLSVSQPESLAGLSSPGGILFIIDEASGFPDDLFHVIRGNAAGGAKILAISNPTLRGDCTWYPELFRSKVWRTLRISSEELALSEERKLYADSDGNLLPGLALPGWIDEMREEYGPDYNNHPQYKIRVLGEFAAEGDETVFRLDDIVDAQARWRADRDCHGPLRIGLDPSWGGTDACGYAAIRGFHTYELSERPGRVDDYEAAARPALEMADRYRTDSDSIVTIACDVVGDGARVVQALEELALERGARVAIVEHNGSEKAHDENEYANRRSEVWYEGEKTLRAGHDLPPGDQIRAELLSAMRDHDRKGRKAVESKQKTKRRGSGSPNLADAWTMAVGAIPAEPEDVDDDDFADERAAGGWM